jgi:hypothetical protein
MMEAILMMTQVRVIEVYRMVVDGGYRNKGDKVLRVYPSLGVPRSMPILYEFHYTETCSRSR